MSSFRRNRLKRCKGCGVLIRWTPVEKRGEVYCCENCALGSLCLCGQLEAEHLLSPSANIGEGKEQVDAGC